MHEIVNHCEIIGAYINDFAHGIDYDIRIGKRCLNSGIGYGGSGFPKGTKALYWLANFNDYELKTIKAAIDVNETPKLKLIENVNICFIGAKVEL
ncbi:hypothetical protein [Neobacillus vireti]|uniref:hypothetical protein n=1 Tax=Neobacillus vireti TaxID=220686 RepID=UPI002FFFA0C8